MIDYFIFDLDGTLIDANKLHRQSFAWAISQVDDFNITLEIEDLLEGVPTLNKVDYINEMYNKSIDKNRIYELKQIYTDANLNTLHMNEDLIDVMRELAKYKSLSLASNARSKFVFSVMSQFNLDFFDVVLTANYLPIDKRKPNPYIFNEALRLLGANRNNACIFEDSEVGIKAALESEIDNVFKVVDSNDTLEQLRGMII